MTIYDIIITVILIGFAIWGFVRGIVRELFEFIGLAAGIYGAYRFAPLLAPQIPFNLYPPLRIAIAGIAILVGVVLIVKLVGWVIYHSLVHGPLKLADRLGGMVLGILTAVIIVMAIVVPISFTPWGAKLNRAAERSQALPLKWALSLAKPVGKYLGATTVTTVSERLLNVLPTEKIDLEPKQVTDLVEQAQKLEEAGVPKQEAVNKLAEKVKRSPQKIGRLLDQADKLTASGLSPQQAGELLTDKDLILEPETIRELMGTAQQLQLSGEKLTKENLMERLPDPTREKLDKFINNPTLQEALKNVDPVEFAKQTGLDLYQTIKQFGMEELWQKYQQKKEEMKK